MKKISLILWSFSLLVALTLPAGALLTKVGEIPVGDGPYNLAITPDGGTIFTAHRGARTPGLIRVIDTASQTAINDIRCGEWLNDLGITPDGTKILATDVIWEQVQVIDVASQTPIGDIDEGIDDITRDVAFTPDSARAFVAGDSAKIFVIDMDTLTVENTISLQADDIAVTPESGPNGSELLITTGGDLKFYNPDTLKPTKSLSITGGGEQIAVTPDGALALVLTEESVNVVDMATRTQETIIPIGGNDPIDVGVSHDGSTALVSYHFDFIAPGYEVTEIDIPTRSVTQELNYSPETTAGWLYMRGIAFHPDTLRAYVVSYEKSRLEVFEPEAAIRPDLVVKYAGSWLGDNEYNGNGENQTARQKKAAGETAKFKVRLYNDGTEAETCFIKGPAGNADWTVEYYKKGKNVTNLVTSTKGWKRVLVPPGGMRPFRIEVTPASGLASGSVLKVKVRAESKRDPTQRDVVKVVTKVK